jgi:hypothetical protein
MSESVFASIQSRTAGEQPSKRQEVSHDLHKKKLLTEEKLSYAQTKQRSPSMEHLLAKRVIWNVHACRSKQYGEA